MYAGQFANLRGPVGDGSGVGGTDGARVTGGAVGMLIEAGAGEPVGVLEPVHAARKAENPTRALPWRNRRRLISASSHAVGSGVLPSRAVIGGPPVRRCLPTGRRRRRTSAPAAR